MFFFFNSVLRPFQDYFSSYEMGQSVGGAKTGEPRENPPGTPHAELGLSHMWPEQGSNPNTLLYYFTNTCNTPRFFFALIIENFQLKNFDIFFSF